MKKILVLALSVALVLGLAACGESEPQHTLAFVDGEFVSMPFNDETWECVFIHTQYTNSSGKSAVPADNLSVKAYQNGVELAVFVMTGQRMDGYVQCDSSVQTGTTANVVWTFRRDDDSPVSVEFFDGQTFTVEG